MCDAQTGQSQGKGRKRMSGPAAQTAQNGHERESDNKAACETGQHTDPPLKSGENWQAHQSQKNPYEDRPDAGRSENIADQCHAERLQSHCDPVWHGQRKERCDDGDGREHAGQS